MKIREFFSEFISTFVLIFFSCGSMIFFELFPDLVSNQGLFISFTFMMSIASMIYVFADISGAHINPAVSFIMFINKSISMKRLFLYIFAQSLGAILASTLHVILFEKGHDFGATRVQIPYLQAFILEVMMSFLLMGVIILSSHFLRQKKIISLVIGASVGLCAYFGGPMTNASMNPVRSLIPMLFSGNFIDWELYLFAPLLGMLIASISLKRWRKL